MRKVILQISGLQRSGNHAIINWIRGQFRAPVFLNDQPHDALAGTSAAALAAAHPDSDCIIVSFEDSRKHLTRTPLLRDSVTLLAPQDTEALTVRRLLILRNPYNTWASRISTERERGLTGNPDLRDFIANWLWAADVQKMAPDEVVLYESWAVDKAYRKALSAALGGTYNDAGIDTLSTEGGGSSFRVARRPSRLQILSRPDRYIGKFLRRPKHYISLFFAAAPSARKLGKAPRWKTLEGNPEAAPLLAHAGVRAEVERIYGKDWDKA